MSAPATEFTRSVTFKPAFDRRHPEPSQNYGIHGVEIRFVLRGPKGATQFLLYTNWQLPEVTRELIERRPIRDAVDLKVLFLPLPADLGYHAYEPRYEGQERMGACDVLPDAPGGCYYDGSGLRAQEVYEALLREGDDGVWARLELEYRELFDGAVFDQAE